MLPKIELPLFTVAVPSTGKQIRLRAMKVKEEKILLMAKEEGSFAQKYNALIQVTNNCVVSEGVDVRNLPLFDLEYIYLKLRMFSVSDKVSLYFKDNQDEKTRKFDVDLNKVEIKKSDVDPKIEIVPSMFLTLRYPPASLYTNSEFLEMNSDDAFTEIMLACMDKIFEGDKVHDCKTSTPEDLKGFIEDIPAKAFEKIQNFFGNIPSLFYEITYKNDNDKEVKIELKTLNDFFPL